MKLQSYANGTWVEGKGDGQELYDACTGEVISSASSEGLDFGAMLDYGRKVGNKNLRKLTFHERGRALKALALYLKEHRKKYYDISFKTGATKIDSWIDIDGGIGNLFANASLRRKLPDQTYYTEGEHVGLSKGGTFIGHHILVPKEGVAVHINAFNFPVWGMLEKCAVNWLSGMPAIVKPATITSFLTEAVVKDIIASGILPEGALQLICGSANTLLDHVNYQDVVTFTGSASTGIKLKSNKNIIAESVPFNIEADSLNAIILGIDAAPGTEEFDVFIKEISKEMTVKAGQKCTAVRRIIVPEKYIEDVQTAIATSLQKVVVGDPRTEGVKMGSLAGKAQVREVKEKVDILRTSAQLVYGDPDNFLIEKGDKSNGAYLCPMLFRHDNPLKDTIIHETEAFGPVSTLMPYQNLEEAVHLSSLGKGSLCSTIVTFDNNIAKDYVINAATHHGRILILNRESVVESTGHGSPMPLLVHGGPGRAGGGEEMGGLRGIKHYMQRCAIQGTPTSISAITDQYQPGGKYIEDSIHPFRKHFEDLKISETWITHKRTITDADIVNFGNVSWDHFYAHTDATSLEGTIFTHRVAHGYFVLSAAAGLFVDPAKGPVLLNYGLEECRFTKPVYAGMTIGVRLTVKEKILQEKKEDEDITKGIVKWYVDIYDDTNETVAIATILTMVRCKNNLG
ncbi:MAG: phenylacetic acid degradation bifunctional protein PaaZ [Saprospiraceae bacterium]